MSLNGSTSPEFILRGKIISISPNEIDKTLSVEGASADAKAAGDGIAEAKNSIAAHEASAENPHKVTKKQVGLENVDNTSDMNKPVSTAQAAAIEKAASAGTEAKTAAENAQTAAEKAQSAADNASTAASNAATAAAAAQNAANGKAAKVTFTAALAAANWAGAAAPYTQTVTVTGILATDDPHWCVALSGDTAAKIAQKEAYACVDDLDTAADSVTFTCLEEKPGADLTIQMEVIR